MNKQRGGKISVIYACALAAAAALAACAVTSTDEPAIGLVEALYNGAPMTVLVTGTYPNIGRCDAYFQEKAKQAHSFPGVEVRYLCVPAGVFKHAEPLAGPAPPAEPAPKNQITRL